MPKTFSKEELEEQYQHLPPVLQDALFNPDIAAKIFAVGKGADLTIEEIGFLAEEVGYLILGLTHPKEFISRLRERIDVEKEVIRKIASEVNSRIFFPLREELKNTHDVDIGALEAEKPRPSAPPLVSVAEKLPSNVGPVTAPPPASMPPSKPPQPPAPVKPPLPPPETRMEAPPSPPVQPQPREMPPQKISFQKLQEEIKSIPIPQLPTKKLEEVRAAQKPAKEVSEPAIEELELELERTTTPAKEETPQPSLPEPAPRKSAPQPPKPIPSPLVTLRLPPEAAKNEPGNTTSTTFVPAPQAPVEVDIPGKIAEDYYRARPEAMAGGGVFAEQTTPPKTQIPKPPQPPPTTLPHQKASPPEVKTKPYGGVDPYRETVE